MEVTDMRHVCQIDHVETWRHVMLALPKTPLCDIDLDHTMLLGENAGNLPHLLLNSMTVGICMWFLP